MIAMQYSIVLPADYDMNIIKQRIASKGHLLDNFPGLIFKAYLSAGKNVAPTHSIDNLYAPFYLWEDGDAMNRFLASDGFAALTRAFGRPVIKVWSVWDRQLHADFAKARYATREIANIAPHTALGALRESEVAAMRSSCDGQGALAAVSAYEPSTWTQVRFCLWRDLENAPPGDSVQRYEVGHLSVPGRNNE